MAKQVIDMKAAKQFSAAQSNEHLRNMTEKGWQSWSTLPHHDRTRSHLNFEIIDGKVVPINTSKSIPERISEILNQRGIKDPNEGLPEPKYRTIVNFIFQGSRERMQQLAFGQQNVNYENGADNSNVVREKDIENWAIDAYNFACKKWGKENIAAFVCHLDELNPHIHFTLLPIVGNGFSFKMMFAGKNKYEFSQRTLQLHNEFADEVGSKWELERGTSTKVTGAKHVNTEQYRRRLSEENSTLEKQLSTAQRRVKGLTTMIDNLEREKENLESSIAELEQKVSNGEGDIDALNDEINNLKERKLELETNYVDKKRKLNIAIQQLEDTEKMISEAKETLNKTTEQLVETNRKIAEAEERNHSLHLELLASGRSCILSALGDFVINSIASSNILRPFDNIDRTINPDFSILESLAESGKEFLQCSALLFAGYVDQATTIAESGGGGGNSPGGGWGKKDDEDEKLFALRCLRQASKMVKPKVKNSRKK